MKLKPALTQCMHLSVKECTEWHLPKQWHRQY